MMLCFNVTINQPDFDHIVCCYGHVFRRKDGHMLQISFKFVGEGQRKKGWSKQMWKKQIGENA